MVLGMDLNTQSEHCLYILFRKNADFRLFDNPVRMGGKFLLRGFYSRKDREILQNGVPAALDGVLFFPCFLRKVL